MRGSDHTRNGYHGGDGIFPESDGKGTLVAMNQEIIAARYATKTNTFQTDTFSGRDEGILGYVQNHSVSYYQESVKKHTAESEFDISELEELPRVEILYEYAGTDQSVLDYMLEERKHYDDETKIVRTSRVGDGLLIRNGEVDDDEYGTIAGNNLNPQKARILLMLALTRTRDTGEIQQIMDTY